MARPGVELIAGIVRDEHFGAADCGRLGGIFVEVFKDTAFRLAPIDRREAKAMLEELRGAAIAARRPRRQPIRLRRRSATCSSGFPNLRRGGGDLKEMDLNPRCRVRAGGQGVDARLLLANGSTAAANRDPNKTQRLQNLRRALQRARRGRDRRQAGRQLHVAARD